MALTFQYQRVRRRSLGALVDRSLRTVRRPDLVRLGSDYGGYVVPAGLLDGESVCYSGGVGEDVTFDTALIERFGCDVWAFDPTPRAITVGEATAARTDRFHFMPTGLWSSDGEAEFFAPRDPSHVSHSITNLQGTATAFTAPVRSVRSLMDELGHDRLTLLKLDIEGAEHSTLSGMISDGIFPTVICLEIDQPVAIRTLISTLRRLGRAGYERVAADGWSFTYVRAGDG